MGPADKTSSTEYVGIIVQSSLKGVTIPKGWGTAQLGCNLVDYLDFSAKQVEQSGKGGSQPAQYDYKATLLMAICLGPIAGIRTIYKDSAIYTATSGGSQEVNGTTITISPKTPLEAAGLSAQFNGAIGQAPWSYLTSNHADHAIGYSGMAYVAAENYDLNSSATTPNHNFEVQFAVRATVNGAVIDDANPADIVNDLIPDVPRWPAGAIADLTNYSNYCTAAGLWLSPVASQGRQASDLLSEVLQASNSDCLWSDGQLVIVPYGDTAITANGVTWTPNLTPIYDLTWDDIIPNSGGEDPIQWDVKRPMDAYNYVQVGYLDRTQQYAADTATAIDQANINTFQKRQQDPVSLNSICRADVANTIAQLMVQRSANVRRTAQFDLSELFGLLDPMDLITVPLRNGGRRLMRIVEADEQEDGSIQVQCEEMLVGTAHAAEYTRQDALGIPSNFGVDAGPTNAPVIINPPLSLTGGQLEVWVGASGGPDWGGAIVWSSLDGSTYQQVGKITQPARYGTTTSNLALTADPDTTDTLGVDLTLSGATLTTATQADADAGVTLCAVGTEVIAFSTATLTAPSKYNLSGYIRRGLEGTTIALQPAGSEFLRLDDSVGIVSYSQGQVGKPLFIKLQSFNVYGNAFEDLDLCTAYEFTAQQNGASVGEVSWTEIAGIPALLLSYVSSGGTANDTSNVDGRPSSTLTQQVDTAAANAVSALGQLPALAAGITTNSGTIAQQALSVGAFQALLQAQTYLSGVPLGTVVTNLNQALTAGQTATNSTLALIGAVSADATAIYLNAASLQVSPGVSLVSTLTQLTSDVGQFSTQLSTETTGRITAVGAVQSQLNLLGATGPGATSIVLNQSTVSISPEQTLGQYIASVTSSLNGNSAGITSVASSVNGLEANISIAANADGQIVGLEFGTSNLPNSGFFDVVTPNWRLVDPTGAHGPTSVMIYSGGLVTFNSNVQVNGDLIIKGTVTATGYVEDITHTSLGAISSGEYECATLVLIGAQGGPLKIDVLVELVNTDTSHNQMVRLELTRDGGLVSDPFYCFVPANTSTSAFPGGWPADITASFFDTGAGAGNHTLVVYAEQLGGTGDNVTKTICRIICQELRTET